MSESVINIFCLPFAGGSSYSYKSFDPFFLSGLQLLPIEIPGRGRRIAEDLLTDVHAVVEDVFAQIKGELRKPYAIYAHSMGTLIGYLLAVRIVKEGLPLPLHLFFSGRGGPSFIDDKPARYSLPQDAFFETLRELGGCPEEILNDPCMMELFEPILRADFEVVETFYYTAADPLPVPIHVIYGAEEDLCEKEIQCWQQETVFPISITQLPGNHFFIYQHQQTLARLISATILKSHHDYGTAKSVSQAQCCH